MEVALNKLRVIVESQYMELLSSAGVEKRYPISTAVNGVGERNGSGCTPRGLHSIRCMIGNDCPKYSVFVGRRPTGELWSPQLAEREPERDWVLSRILWLTGRKSGYNRGGRCDSLRRFIYIHGTPPTEPMGIPRSHGCIRMRNSDVIELYDRVTPGIDVEILG